MAMVKLGSGIVEIEGKSGGNIWRKDQCGQHVQSYPREIERPSTLAQRKRRRAYLRLMNYIRRYSTLEFVQRWQSYSHHHPRNNRKGESHTLTWWQMFISTNVNRVVNGEDILDYPPE
jgi:hypothetical protein